MMRKLFRCFSIASSAAADHSGMAAISGQAARQNLAAGGCALRNAVCLKSICPSAACPNAA